MIFNITAIIIGALGGLAAAITVDYEAWKSHPNTSFNWMLAIRRWLTGAVLGAAAAVGFTNVSPAPTEV